MLFDFLLRNFQFRTKGICSTTSAYLLTPVIAHTKKVVDENRHGIFFHRAWPRPEIAGTKWFQANASCKQKLSQVIKMGNIFYISSTRIVQEFSSGRLHGG